MEARPGGELGAHCGVFVRGVIVDDKMRIELCRHVGVDMLEEAQELLMTMPRATLREDPAIGDIEGGEQRRRAVSDGGPIDLSPLFHPPISRVLASLNCPPTLDHPAGFFPGCSIRAGREPLIDR